MTNGTISYGSANFAEICFNGMDDNGNGNTDCSDALCFNSVLGVDAWKTADPACGGGFNPTEFGHTIGAGFDPERFKNDLMSRGMSSDPPVDIGEDDLNDTVAAPNSTELDIDAVTIKDADVAFAIGIETQTNIFAPHCHPYNGENVKNMTQKFFYVVDSDNNASTGCDINYTLGRNNTQFTLNGTDYLYNYVIDTAGAEIRVGYRCTNISNTYKMAVFSAGLSDVPPYVKPFICADNAGGGGEGYSNHLL
jgi:hypothetical protein